MKEITRGVSVNINSLGISETIDKLNELNDKLKEVKSLIDEIAKIKLSINLEATSDAQQEGEVEISEIKTCELVSELIKREGVEKIIVSPYEKKNIETEGPMIILKIID